MFISANPNQGKIDAAQDAEIGEKADKSYVDQRDAELASGVSSAISMVVSAINANTDAIYLLSARTDDIEERLSDAESAISATEQSVEELFSCCSAVNETLSALSQSLDETNSAVSAVVESVEELFETKADKEYVDNIASALSDDIQALSDRHDAELSAIGETVDELSGLVYSAVSEISDTKELALSAMTKAEDVEESVEALSGQISGIVDTVEDLSARTEDVEEKIDIVSGLMESLEARVVAEEEKSVIFSGQIADLYEVKADKTDLQELSAKVGTVEEGLQELSSYTHDNVAEIKDDLRRHQEEIREIQESISGFAKQEDVDALSATVEDLKVTKADVADLNALNLRVQADEAKHNADIEHLSGVIDTKVDTAVFEAHESYAESTYAKQSALDELAGQIDDFVTADEVIASCYTKSQIDEKEMSVLSALDAKADTSAMTEYVEASVSGKADADDTYTKSEVDDIVQNAVNEAKAYSDSADTSLQDLISLNSEKIATISELKTDEAGNYVDTGNGILDVLHREFHAWTGSSEGYHAEGGETKNKNEYTVGQYNESHRQVDSMGREVQSGCTMFSVGIGSSDADRKNGMEVMKDGSIWLWVEGNYMCLNDLVAQIANETYDTDGNTYGGGTYSNP